jgi:hypothetical protein
MAFSKGFVASFGISSLLIFAGLRTAKEKLCQNSEDLEHPEPLNQPSLQSKPHFSINFVSLWP